MHYYTLIIRFVLLVLLQLAIVRPIEMGRWVDFYIYPLFILMLPVNFRAITVMLLGAVCGLSIDLMQNTPGLNAAVCVAVAILRKPMLQLFIKPDDLKNDLEPLPSLLGNIPFTVYAGVFLIIFHLLLFNIESFRGGLFFFNLLRTAINALIALGFSWFLLILFFRTSNR